MTFVSESQSQNTIILGSDLLVSSVWEASSVSREEEQWIGPS